MRVMSSELIGIVAPALLAGFMIALTHAPLGIEVLKRGIIFIDLAVAQIAGLGIIASLVVAERFMADTPALWMAQAVALGCAILAGLFFRKVERTMPDQQEAIIGVSFVLAAVLAILLLADRAQSGQEIQHLLSGQMLFITCGQVATHAPIYGLILALWFMRPIWRQGIGFYLLFALAITSSVQLVGVYVVFASLILPALAAIGAKHPHGAAWLCGMLAVLGGIVAALLADAPAGPVIVVSYVVTSILFRLCRRVKIKPAN